MINEMKMGLIALLGVVIWGLTPGVGHAANTHDQACNVCHRSSASPRSMANLCVVCHIKTETNTVARFDVGTASDTLGHNGQAGTDSGAETTHNWGGFSTNWAPAGSTYPPTTFYSSRYSISTKRITCSICHDPHGVTGTNYLVRAAIAGDVLCQQCHSSWFILNDSNDANPVNDTNALLTHPVVTDYATFAAANPTDYNPTPANASNGGSGEVRLVDGGVSCTSCHGTHYADSSSGTTDGTTAYNNLSLAKGDGNLLRADGPLRTGGTRNGATGTAQLRSNLCQSCHKIELHGQGASGDHRIGCLDCHGGHAYNGGVPNAYILNKMTPDAVPTRPDRVNGASVQVTFNNFPNGASTRITWADENVGGTEGFCEKCHGDVNSTDMVNAAEAHGVADTNECDVCHKHNDPADLYAFNRDASAATCGQCHGFPPYINTRGDQGNDPDGTGPNPPLGTLGGYAWNYVDLPAYDYVSSTTHEKDEDKTGHMVHAGADLPTSPAGAGDWYFVGNSGVDNCKVCHGPDAGTPAGNHRINQANTFRDLPFDGVAKTGGMSPVYKTGAPNIWTCSNVYCHTNGAPYTGASRPTRNYSVTNVTPAWDQANGGGFNAIYGNANRCQFCHGNNTTSMASKSNSAAHQAHLGATTTLNMAKVFDCKVCHVNTAGSPTALKAGAMDGRNGVGKHVNGLIEVDFETGATPNTLPFELTDSTYTATTGVCATYCHNVTGDAGAFAADWDVATDMQCDSCHGGLLTDSSGNGGYGPIPTDSHPLHVTDINGPRLACTVCHGVNANTGKHGTHFDGAFDFTAGVCDTCHGYDLAQGEALPVWGATPYADPDPAKRDDYCIACHTGTTTPELASGGIATGAPAKTNALATGHGKPSSTYTLSGNNAANRACTACHDSSAAGHFDGISGDDKRLLLGSNGFPVAYSTIADKNNYCGACHGTTPGHSLPSTKTGINTHQGKACIGCHDPHGDSNRSMILTSKTTQNAKDTTTGKFFGDVTFTAQTGAFSYDEDEGAAGNAGEINANDICAPCHTTGGGSAHNNQQNLPATGTHSQGTNCLAVCHNAHNDVVETNAFGGGAGTACNDCHGYPPATGDARHTAAKIGAHELHASSLLNVGGAEASDCEVCHPGATGYGLSAFGTHMDSSIGGATTLAAGMAGGTATCTNSCHLSSATVDGYWTDTTKAGYSGNGLNCNACHYAANTATATGALNLAAGTRQLSAVHNEHFDKSKGCAECHDVSYSAGITPIPGGASGLIHISGGASDGTLAYYQNRAQALPDEATVGSLTRPTMTYSGGVADAAGSNNTCSNGIGVGCHATGSPDWDVTIPATSAGCVMCHTGTSLNTVDPTSSLHAVTPTVTGKQHSTGFTYNAGANTADCLTCHTASPTITAADHINGTFNASIGADAAGSGGQKITLVAGLGYADAVVPTCNVSITGCHTAKTAGRSWLYKWHNNGAAINGSQCDGCHGMWTAWNGGVVAHRSGSEAETVHGTGALYKCRDCHGLESASGYPYTTTSNDWKPNLAETRTTLHGDGLLNINIAGSTAFTRATYAGCTGCHTASDGVAAGQHAFTLTTWTTPTFSGDAIVVSCSSCHGGATIVGANSNYWPDGANTLNDNGTADNRGAHLIHITKLATTVMGQDITQLLTDNAGVGIGGWITATADAKQRELCSYCHLAPIGTNAGHGVTYPAQLTSMFNLWNKGADNVAYSTSDGTCATSDCHYNKTTPTVPNYGWYGGQASACVICHTNGASDTTHTEHLGGGFGRVINCTDCHAAGTTTTTVPSIGHIDGTFKGDGGTIIDGTTKTYSGGTCGTNVCHNDGKLVAGVPYNSGAGSYAWGTALADCTACHNNPNSTGNDGARHSKHMTANVAYVPGGCVDCHPVGSGTAGTHLNGTIQATGSNQTGYNAGNGTCTNSCHATSAGVWTDTAALACTDCHSGSYVGIAAMPQYAMHTLTPTVSGVVHDATVPGAGGDCAFCHDSMPASGGSHINGSTQGDLPNNTDRGMFAGFTDGVTPTCATSCHSAGTTWRYKWSASAGATNGSECANCHGDYNSGWNTGVGHAAIPARGNAGVHAATGSLTYECTACHVIGDTTGNYPWTTGSNDWKPNLAETRTTLHGDGDINVNQTGATPTRSTNAGCQGCHSVPDGSHDFPISSWNLIGVTGDSPAVGGGCDGCHGGAGEFAPNNTGVTVGVYPDRAGKHPEHVAAIAVKIGGNTQSNRNATCKYCHLPTTLPDTFDIGVHNDDAVPSNVDNIRHIIDYNKVDGNPVVNRADNVHVTCSTIDCHFNNAVTPHWYDDDVPPAPLLIPNIAASTGTEPNSIKITWTSPGDDGNTADTTPYKYEMRYGTTPGDATTYSYTPGFPGDPLNYVGGMPMAYKQGSPQEVTVRDLTPGQTYYFTLKTWDVAGNVSTISDMVSAVASGDSKAPDFGGINSAVAGDESATINVDWTSAEDHTMPITYKLWMIVQGTGSGPNGALDMTLDAPLLTGLTNHHYQLTSANGIVDNTTYYLGVRACDNKQPTPNCDTNVQVVEVTPKAPSVVAKTYSAYVTNNAAAPVMTKGGSYGGTASTLAVLTTKDFIASAPYPANTTVYADTFSIYLENSDRRNPYNVSVTLGYSANGTTWVGTKGVSKTVSVGAGAKRVVSFKLSDTVTGKTFNNGEYLAIRLQDVATSGKISTSYGSSATRGDLTVAERLINSLPSNPNLQATPSGAMVNMTWTPSTDVTDGVDDTVNLHYDIYGSFNGGPYNHLIASGLPVATNSYSWNTQESGFTSGTVAVRIAAGDGYEHVVSTVTGIPIDNTSDNVAPAQIKDLRASKRPKDGTVLLKWSAPGDDEENHGRARYYDIRYSTASIDEGNWSSATQVLGEPTPDFGGETQTYEVTGLTAGTLYYFGVKTVDEGAKVSALSTVKTAGDNQQVGGPRCGMCHTTAPSVVESVGNHKLHGITLHDCANCHGTAVESFGLDHQDGVLTMGYGDGGQHQAIISGNRIYYTNNGLPMGAGGDFVLYDDTDGGHGFNNPANPYVGIGDDFDNGSCFNFKTRSVGGCHGPAGNDPDGTANGDNSAPYVSPTWDAAATQVCANCHGDPGRTVDSFYTRPFDGGVANPDQIKGTPPVDNHGYSYADAGTGVAARKYIGQHEKHLNYSFRFSKGDNCNLCHIGKYAVRNNLDGKHANGEIDVKLDTVAAGVGAYFTAGADANTAGTCFNMSPESCHPSAAQPKWDSSENYNCVQCHGMGGSVPSHTTDPTGSGFVDDGLGNCEWCHFGGHPRSDLGGTSLILSNNSQVGISYRSDGIHLKKSIGGRVSYNTEAELCWGCHDTQSPKISEWVNDEGNNNHASTKSTNAFDINYNYGQVNSGSSASWYANKTPGSETGASWVSPNFTYKTGAIKSTHSTNYAGTSAISGAFKARTEALDAVANIRCSNCHDVHNLNKASGDTMTGKPYLRGTWIRNPYREDGAPLSSSTYTSANRFNTVPRGGSQHNEYGGFQIDQNNGNPTAGLSLPQTAGLCTLCHGTDVNTMDRYLTGTSGPKTDSENYWVGTGGNGHSNGVIGGTGTLKSDIFNFAQRNPTTAPVTYTGSYSHGGNPSMGYQNALDLGTGTRAGGFRSQYGTGSYGYNVQPLITADFAYNDFNWGVTQDTGTADEGYHNFTCSKCHNPHASRLPKLMITNCLDTSKNTWDNTRTVPASGGQNTASADNANKTLSQAGSAQNCHRLGDSAQSGKGGGWNTITPW